VDQWPRPVAGEARRRGAESQPPAPSPRAGSASPCEGDEASLLPARIGHE